MPADSDDRDQRDRLPSQQALNGHLGQSVDHDEEDPVETREVPGQRGRWVHRGGLLFWEEPDEDDAAARDPRADLASHWAEDQLDLPDGAPEPLRVRAVRAWLGKQRLIESGALGDLLLRRRAEQPDAVASPADASRPGGAFDVAMAEHQAAIDEYERLIEALSAVEQHSGTRSVLVEFYLAVMDRLSELANAPEAPRSFAPHLRVSDQPEQAHTRPDPRAAAEWQGRVDAILLTRQRVERVTMPEGDDD
jgi:hypothetical protein